MNRLQENKRYPPPTHTHTHTHTLTGQRAGEGLAFVRKADVIDDLLHLSFHLLLRQTLQPGVEPDMLLYCQPGGGEGRRGEGVGRGGRGGGGGEGGGGDGGVGGGGGEGGVGVGRWWEGGE